MPIRDLTNEEMLQLLTLYQNAFSSALNQPNNKEEDIALLNHMVSNVNFIKRTMQVQPPSNKLTWKIMTFITGSPQVLNSTRTYVLQADSDQNINQNILQSTNNPLINSGPILKLSDKDML